MASYAFRRGSGAWALKAGGRQSRRAWTKKPRCGEDVLALRHRHSPAEIELLSSFSPAPAMMWCVAKRLKSTDARANCTSEPKSTRVPLLLSFKRGKYKLNLPLAKATASTPIGATASSDRQTAFSFHPDHSLDAVKASIREEGVSSVEFVGPGDKPLPDESTISDVAWHGGFDLKLDGKQFPVLATRAGGYGDEEEGAGGRAELASLLERGRVMRLRAALADETRRSMTYAEFENLCEDCGMDEADARKVAADLHKVGVVLHFHKEPGLTDIVYLQPHQVLEHFFAKYDLDSPLRQYLLQRADVLSEERKALERELVPTLALKAALESQARRTVSRCMWGLSATVVCGAGGYWYLSYVYLSWDIMEPVTFFTALGVTMFSYAWWMFTNQEYQYSNVYDFFVKKMRDRKFRGGHLDEGRLAQAQKELAKLESKKKVLESRIFELECMRNGPMAAANLGPYTDEVDEEDASGNTLSPHQKAVHGDDDVKHVEVGATEKEK